MTTIHFEKNSPNSSTPADRLGPNWGAVTRRNCFAVLAAIRQRFPQSDDAGCSGGGRISVDTLAASAGLTRGAALKSLRVWRTWRVLWLRGCGEEIELRFDRRVVVGLLTADRVVPSEVEILIARHRARREAIAPRRSACSLPRTNSLSEPGCAARP